MSIPFLGGNDPPLAATIAEEITLLDHWDDDALFRRYLQSMPEPTEVIEYGRLDAYLRCVRMRIRELSKAREDIAPHKSAVLDNVLAKEMFRRKVLLWQLFPIREFPAEILVEIFRHVVLPANVMKGEATQKLSLTWVCRRFRAVALADGRLWSRIVFRDPVPWVRSLTFFDRAGEAPLHIFLDDTVKGVPKVGHHHAAALVQRLKTKAHNIRSLVLTLSDWLASWVVIKMFSDVSAPQLDFMRLDRYGEPFLWTTSGFANNESKPPLPFFNGHAPNVSNLSLNGISVNWDSVNSAKLRVLDLRRIAPDVAPTMMQFRALISSTNLEKLCLHAVAPSDKVAGVQAVHMPKLYELSLCELSCYSLMTVLDTIEAPSLRIFGLLGMAGMDYTPIFSIYVREFQNVEMLSIRNVKVERSRAARAQITTWIDMMVKLRVLTLEGPWSSIFLRTLKEDPLKYRHEEHPYAKGRPPPALAVVMRTIAPSLHTLVLCHLKPRELQDVLAWRETTDTSLSLVAISKPIWERWTPEIQSSLYFLGTRLELIPNYPSYVSREEARIRSKLDSGFRAIFGVVA